MAPDNKRLALLGYRISSIFNAPDPETPLLRTALHNKAAASQPEKPLLPAPTRRRKPPPDMGEPKSPEINETNETNEINEINETKKTNETNETIREVNEKMNIKHTSLLPQNSQPYSHNAPASPHSLGPPSPYLPNSLELDFERSPQSMPSPVRSLGSLLALGQLGEYGRENLSDIIQTLELEIDNFQFQGTGEGPAERTESETATPQKSEKETPPTETQNLGVGEITRDMADMSWLSRSDANLSVRLSVLANQTQPAPPSPQLGFPYPIDSPVVPSPVASPVSPVASPGYSPSKHNFYFPDDATASQTSLADVPVSRPFVSGASTTVTETSGGRQSDMFALGPPGFHRKSTSLSSLYSTSSNRNVNLATLKMTLDLKPGEGEQSRYVVALRRSMGTAVNDSPPDKWKLPTGILPVDKRASMASSNGRYLRLGVSQGRKKTSGVELKHGHLQPRLLAAEVGDSRPYLGGSGLGASSARDSRASIYSSTSATGNSTANSGVETSGSSSPVRSSSKEDETRSVRTSLAALIPELIPELALVTSSSSGSIDDVRGYYQHPAYTGSDEAETEACEPRLVLVNPDEVEG